MVISALFHLRFVFQRDNFPLGTVLKVSSVIEEHDKVRISLIMEALGKYKETLCRLKLPHPKMLKYTTASDSNVPRLKELERLR